jgi:hypothetical protein
MTKKTNEWQCNKELYEQLRAMVKDFNTEIKTVQQYPRPLGYITYRPTTNTIFIDYITILPK